jgi:hypothetical protein
MMLWYHDFRALGLDSENLGRGLGRGTWCDVSSVSPKADGGGYVLVMGDGPKCSSWFPYVKTSDFGELANFGELGPALGPGAPL